MFRLSEPILLSDLNNLLVIWFWAMSALSKRLSFSFVLGLRAPSSGVQPFCPLPSWYLKHFWCKVWMVERWTAEQQTTEQTI